MQAAMNTEQITPDGEVDVNDQAAPTSQGEESTKPEIGNDAIDTAEHSRESLIQSLIQKPVEEKAEEEVSEEVSEDDDDEEPEGDSAPVSKKSDDDEPKSLVGADLAADKRLGERTKKTIDELRKAAAFGDVITQMLTKNKISPEEFANWTALAAQVKNGDKEAIGTLIATAKAFGWKESAPVEAPKVKSVDDVAKEIYDAEFASEVDDLQIGEQVARKQSRRLAELQIKAERPAPEPEKIQPRAPQDQQRHDPIREAAIAEVVRLEKEYEAKIPNFAKIATAVNERLSQASRTSNPLMWTAVYQDIVRDEVRKASPVTERKPIKPVAGTQVRSSSAPAPKPVEIDSRAQLIRDIAAGKFVR
jgi:hypothetical protein